MQITLTVEQIDFLLSRIDALLEFEKRNDKARRQKGFGLSKKSRTTPSRTKSSRAKARIASA